MDGDDSFGPSDLGTKEYWDNIYERDKKNYRDHGDVGEIWFGEDSHIRVLNWLTTNDVKKSSKIIDLGCGNGMALVELHRIGYTDLTGVDFSASAIELAKSVLDEQSMTAELQILDITAPEIKLEGYDVVLDKGTFDAISLHPESADSKKQSYSKNVHQMLNEKGYLILTSCNWTEHELIEHFSINMVHVDTLPTPKFSFGGKTGNIISTVVFQKSSS